MPLLRRRIAMLAVSSLLGASLPAPAQSPRPLDPELAAGIALVREGDFENAVLKLDTVVRRLLSAPGTHQDAAQAYVYLGVAFLELNQELVARGKFQLAQALDPQLRLDPRQFSPEQIRVFEAARAEAAARAPSPRSSPSPAAPAAVPSNEKKKRSALPWILGGAAVIGGGAAAAAGGGGGGPAPPNTTTIGNTTSTAPTTQPAETTTTTTTQPGPPTTTTVPVTTTTTSTTTTLPAGCSSASVGGSDKPAYSPLGDSGSCPVTAPASCTWSAAAVGNPNWVTLTTSSGTGSGQIRFNLAANPFAPAREATIFLVQNTAASCTIRQSATLLTDTAAPSVTFTSDLELAGGQGQVVVDGAAVSYQARGTQSGSLEARPGVHRIEAMVVSAAGTPGTWRFRLSGPLRPGSLRVIAGMVAMAGGDEVVFRLSGQPGERMLVSFRLH